MKENWLIYGATGFTGRLVAEEALRRGHHPVLAARSAEKLGALAGSLGLDSIAFDLQGGDRLARILEDFQAVFHAAGPFRLTGGPMLTACLKAGTHYLDITGEIPVLEANLALDPQAKAAGISVVSGSGFDVVPTDCLANIVAHRLSHPTYLEIAFAGISRSSAGTIKSGLVEAPLEVMIRRDGRLVHAPLGFGGKWVCFSDRERYVLPVPWGDVATAYHSTGIGNIVVYMAFPPQVAASLRTFGLTIQGLLRPRGVQALVSKAVDLFVRGPDEEARRTNRSYIWAWARNELGESREAWLETIEPYQFTAVTGVRCVEKVLAGEVQPGAFTPAQAYGSDFILEMPETRLLDA